MKTCTYCRNSWPATRERCPSCGACLAAPAEAGNFYPPPTPGGGSLGGSLTADDVRLALLDQQKWQHEFNENLMSRIA